MGGANDTVNRLFPWRQLCAEAKEDAPTPLERYQIEIAGCEDPDDPRLLPSGEIEEQAKHGEEESLLVNNKRRFVLFPIEDEEVSSVWSRCVYFSAGAQQAQLVCSLADMAYV